MFLAIWDLIVELSVGGVEWVVRLEDVVVEPQLTVGNEQFTIQVISDSTSVLYLSYHVLNGFP